jgi:hypothetical protein
MLLTELPRTSAVFLFRIALTSAWQTYCIEIGQEERSKATLQHRVLAGKAHRVLRIKLIVCMSAPWKLIVAAASRKPIVPHPYDSFVSIHDARTDLGGRILGTHGRQEGDSHKVVIPRNDIVSFQDFGMWN